MSTELTWFKSSYSGSEGGACLEVAYGQTGAEAVTVHVRDSKNPTGPAIAVTPSAWTAFTSILR